MLALGESGDATGHASGPAVTPGARPNELLALVAALRRRWFLIVTIALTLSASAVAVVLSITPYYAATATILIDPNQVDYAELANTPGSARTVWPNELETYIRILRSDDVAEAVVQGVGLRAFVPTPRLHFPQPTWLPAVIERTASELRQLSGQILQLSPFSELPDPTAGKDQTDPTVESAVAEFDKNLKVERDSLAAAISITYSSADARVAATVANATADAFLEELVRARRETLGTTTNYLRQRVEALRQELEEVETKAKFAENELTGPDGGAAIRARVQQLNDTLSSVEIDASTTRADLSEINAPGAHFLPRLATDALRELQQKERDLVREVAAERATLGERHPRLVERNAALQEVRSAIIAEQKRIRDQLRYHLQASEERTVALRAEIARLSNIAAGKLQHELGVKQLTASGESVRQLYGELLSRYQQASEQQLIIRPAARVLNRAGVPASPDRKKQLTALIAAIAGSIGAGAGVAFLCEIRRRGFSSAQELESWLGVPVYGALPLVRHGSRAHPAIGKSRTWQRHAYAEAMARLALRIGGPPARRAAIGKVVLVTSAIAAEGKSVLSLALARQLDATGHRVLLFDADLHRRGLSGLVNPLETQRRSPPAVADYKSIVQNFTDTITRDPRSGVDIVAPTTWTGEPAKLLGSPQFSDFLSNARARYDIILLDAPPVLPVSDVAATAYLADLAILVVRWQSTPRAAASAAIREIRSITSCNIGVVLNMVSFRQYSKDELGKSRSYYQRTIATRVSL